MDAYILIEINDENKGILVCCDTCRAPIIVPGRYYISLLTDKGEYLLVSTNFPCANNEHNAIAPKMFDDSTEVIRYFIGLVAVIEAAKDLTKVPTISTEFVFGKVPL